MVKSKATKKKSASRKRRKISQRNPNKVLMEVLGIDFIDMSEFRSRLRIDRHNLDEEVEQQAELYNEVAEGTAVAKSAVDAEQKKLDELYADLDAKIRRRYIRDDERLTENNLKADIARNEDYRAQGDLLIELKKYHGRLLALSTSFRARGYMLRDLVELYLSSYYSSSSHRSTRGKFTNVKSERIKEKMNEKRKGRVKSRRKSIAQP